MSESIPMGQQQLRDMALNAMLVAVDAQAAALKSMDREHSFGIENSFSVEHLRGQVKDLVQSAHMIVSGCRKCEFSETREKIQALASVSRRVKGEADLFKTGGAPKAKQRFDSLLLQVGVDEPKATPVPPSEQPAGQAPTNTDIAHDPRKLSAQAGFACLRAEIDAFEAFAMQIHAVCNLALEYALNAAVESSRSNGNI